MAATTIDRNTLTRYIQRTIYLKLATGADIPAGAMVATDAAGNAVNASDTAALVVQGRADHRATQANGDVGINVSRGTFCYGNDGSVLQSSVGKLCEVVDNQTVSLVTTTNHVKAGAIDEVNADGVWVSMLGGLVAAA